LRFIAFPLMMALVSEPLFFLKGCPMQCSWCHNHESQNAERQLYFDPGTCAKCGNCVYVCPTNVHSISNEAHLINYDRCNLSGKCVEVCPEDALKIIGQEMTIEDVLAEVERTNHIMKDHRGCDNFRRRTHAAICLFARIDQGA
jgi:ferredoxin